MFEARGDLVKCEMDDQVTLLSLADKTQRVLADQYMGQRCNAPNDLVIDAQGGVYFTDPDYRAPQPLPQGSFTRTTGPPGVGERRVAAFVQRSFV